MSENSDIAFINKRLRDFVEQIGDTGDRIAEKMGVSRSTLYSMLRPGGTIKHENLYALKKHYGLDIDSLFESPHNSKENNTEKEGDQASTKEMTGPAAGGAVQEDLTEYELRQLSEFEQIVHRIEHGPWPPKVKLSVITSLVNIIEKDFREPPREKDPNHGKES